MWVLGGLAALCSGRGTGGSPATISHVPVPICPVCNSGVDYVIAEGSYILWQALQILQSFQDGEEN